MTCRLTLLLSSHACVAFDSYPNSASQPVTRIQMPDDVEKESERTRKQRVWEEKRQEKRRRQNEQRLEGQRREFERKCDALRRKATAGDEGDAAARAKNENGGSEGGACVDQLGDGVEPQPLREEASRSDGHNRRSGKSKQSRRATTKAERNAGRASPVPAKNEHPELHVIAQVRLRAHLPRMTKLIGMPPLFAQLTPLAPPSPPLTPRGEASLHSGKSETCRQDEDIRTRMEADYLFDAPLRCASLSSAASTPPLTVAESAQTREAAADVLFSEPQLLCVESSDSTVAAIVPIVKICRASAAFYRNSGEPGNTRQPQKFFRGRGRGRGFGWYGRGGRAPRSEPTWTKWG